MRPKRLAEVLLILIVILGVAGVVQHQVIRTLEARLEAEEIRLMQEKERLHNLLQEVQMLREQLEQLQESWRRVQYVASRLLRCNPALGERLASQVAAQILESTSRHGVPVDLVILVGAQESGWRLDVRGRHGEYGPLQVLPETFRLMGGSDPRDWRQALDTGVRYLAKALQLSGGDVRLALARYNSGVNRDASEALRISGRYAKAVLARSDLARGGVW